MWCGTTATRSNRVLVGGLFFFTEVTPFWSSSAPMENGSTGAYIAELPLSSMTAYPLAVLPVNVRTVRMHDLIVRLRPVV